MRLDAFLQGYTEKSAQAESKGGKKAVNKNIPGFTTKDRLADADGELVEGGEPASEESKNALKKKDADTLDKKAMDKEADMAAVLRSMIAATKGAAKGAAKGARKGKHMAQASTRLAKKDLAELGQNFAGLGKTLR